MILITGCAGFIGFHLAERLLKEKKRIIGIDNINNYYPKHKKKQRLKILKKYKNFVFIKQDLNNFIKLKKNLYKFKFKHIVHLAAQPGVRISIKNPHNTLTQNLTTFSNIIEIARLKKVKKFIYASSSSIYGDTKLYPFTEKDYKNVPVSVYGATKLSNEIIAESYSRNFNLCSVGLRFFTVYGPFGRPDMAYYSFLKNLDKNKPIKVFNYGKMLRDFTYIDDVIIGIKAVINLKNKIKHEVLNIGKGKPDKLMDLIKFLEIYRSKRFKINFTKNIPNGDIRKTYSNVTKAKNLIGWKPSTDLKTGVKMFVKWHSINNE